MRFTLPLLALVSCGVLLAACATGGPSAPGGPPDADTVAGNWLQRPLMTRGELGGDLLCLDRFGRYVRIDDETGVTRTTRGTYLVGDEALVLESREGRQHLGLRQEGSSLLLSDERGRERRYERTHRACE